MTENALVTPTDGEISDAPVETRFSVKAGPQFTSVKMFHPVSEVVSVDFKKAIAKAMETPQNMIVGLAGVPTLSEEWIKVFQFISKALEASEKKLALIYAPPDIPESAKLLTAPDSLGVFRTLEAERKAGLQGQKVHYVKAFVACTLRTLFVQTGAQSSLGRLFYVDDRYSEKLLGDISGIITVSSEEYSYVVILSFPESTYLKIISRFLGEEITTMNPGIVDGAAELLNIIYGQSKVLINRDQRGFKPSLPSLVVGKSFNRSDENQDRAEMYLYGGKALALPFESDCGPFFIQVAFPESVAKLILS